MRKVVFRDAALISMRDISRTDVEREREELKKREKVFHDEQILTNETNFIDLLLMIFKNNEMRLFSLILTLILSRDITLLFSIDMKFILPDKCDFRCFVRKILVFC